MATWKPDGLITKGAQAAFFERLADIPEIWPNHCMKLNSTTQVEPHAFPGYIPAPREFVNGRQIQGLRDFTYNVENNEYELSIAINRRHFEDDQTDTIASRMRECAEVWGTFKDYLFHALLNVGRVAGNTAFDDVVFHGDARTIGSSGTIDNSHTAAAATGTLPTLAELKAELGAHFSTMRKFKDDQGRPFNSLAGKKIRVIIPPDYEWVYKEAFTLASPVTGGDNVWFGVVDLDILDYADGDAHYTSFVGAERKPFVYQERTPLEVQILDDPASIAYHNAVLVLCRQRFVFAYGDPRRSAVFVWS